ncbi:hypothetical protein [Pseudomonas aeruginosa]|uniref:hypothetical protein n=1 Tax=Pseudomonas aeruginosa TaxID=287 RepID=UPI001374FCD2|nr:hypothetical protein [Pseudomonas aeruginosa]
MSDQSSANVSKKKRDARSLGSCHDELIFALQDKHHAFSLGLSTVLQCLKMAEHEGVVPELPEGWWSRMANRYRLN